MLNKITFSVCRFIWWIIPLWLSDLIYRKTGYLMSYRFDLDSGKPVAFYIKPYTPLDPFSDYKGFMVKSKKADKLRVFWGRKWRERRER